MVLETRKTVWTKKDKVLPGIRTQPGQKASNCSTTCTTTAPSVSSIQVHFCIKGNQKSPSSTWDSNPARSDSTTCTNRLIGSSSFLYQTKPLIEDPKRETESLDAKSPAYLFFRINFLKTLKRLWRFWSRWWHPMSKHWAEKRQNLVVREPLWLASGCEAECF